MAKTPDQLLDALELVTAPRPPVAEAARASGFARTETPHVRRVRDVSEDRNIVAVGISENVTEKKNTGELSLSFYVDKKIPKSKMRAGKMVPPVMASRDGRAVFTDVKAIGRIRPPIKRKVSPIQSGFSVAHGNVGAGTLGAIVKKGNKLFILSNSHVLADAGLAKVVQLGLAQSPFDWRGLRKRTPIATCATCRSRSHGE